MFDLFDNCLQVSKLAVSLQSQTTHIHTMSVLPTHRRKDWEQSLKDFNKKNQKWVDPKWLEMDIVWDLDTQFGFNTDKTKILSGDVVRKQFFTNLEMEICKRSEATLLIIIGEKHESGCWLIGKCKNYWLRPKRNE